MPIYAYKCESCGHARDVLRKVSDPPLTECPACGAQSFVKQLTAAGFQLKGSGWYATDFKGGSTAKPDKADKAGTTTDAKPGDSSEGSKSGSGESKPATKTEASPAAAGGCGASCACH